MVKTLSEFKKYLADGGTVELIEFATYSDNYKQDGSHEGISWNLHQAHRGYRLVRKADKIQTKNVKLEGGSWLDLDPAKCWTFKDDKAIRTEITEQWHGGYDSEDNYQAKLYKRSEHGNRLEYKLV